MAHSVLLINHFSTIDAIKKTREKNENDVENQQNANKRSLLKLRQR